jgi:DNA-binding response OmpR family regulator
MLHSTILVVAKDRFIASLLGGLIELSGRIVAYKSDDEGCDSAVRRTHPELVMFDCALGIPACSEIAAVVRVEGSRLLMFSASHTDREARDIASLYSAQSFVLPIKPREFMESLDRAIGTTAFPS